MILFILTDKGLAFKRTLSIKYNQQKKPNFSALEGICLKAFITDSGFFFCVKETKINRGKRKTDLAAVRPVTVEPVDSPSVLVCVCVSVSV